MTDHNKQTPADLDSNQAAPTTGRRDFLKGVASASAAGVALVQQAQAATPAGPANSKLSDVDAKAVESGRLIPRPGSDFMVDVIKSLNVEYVAANPGSSFRSLHESVVNYGGNKTRFLAPVRSGKRVRGHFKLLELVEKRPGQWQQTLEFTVEIEGEDKPALQAEWISQFFV